MKFSRIALMLFLCSAMWACKQDEDVPQNLERYHNDQFTSTAIGKSVGLNVYLPEGYYDNPDKVYPVLYFLHGYNGNGQDWFESTALRDLSENYQDMILVAPTQGGQFYTNFIADETLRYEDMIVEDVVSYVETTYRAKKWAKSRGLVGFDAGGFAAVKIALKYPEKFKFAFSLSGDFELPHLEAADYINESFGDDYAKAFGAEESFARQNNDPEFLAPQVNSSDRMEYIGFYVSQDDQDRYNRTQDVFNGLSGSSSNGGISDAPEGLKISDMELENVLSTFDELADF